MWVVFHRFILRSMLTQYNNTLYIALSWGQTCSVWQSDRVSNLKIVEEDDSVAIHQRLEAFTPMHPERVQVVRRWSVWTSCRVCGRGCGSHWRNNLSCKVSLRTLSPISLQHHCVGGRQTVYSLLQPRTRCGYFFAICVLAVVWLCLTR